MIRMQMIRIHHVAMHLGSFRIVNRSILVSKSNIEEYVIDSILVSDDFI